MVDPFSSTRRVTVTRPGRTDRVRTVIVCMPLRPAPSYGEPRFSSSARERRVLRTLRPSISITGVRTRSQGVDRSSSQVATLRSLHGSQGQCLPRRAQFFSQLTSTMICSRRVFTAADGSAYQWEGTQFGNTWTVSASIKSAHHTSPH